MVPTVLLLHDDQATDKPFQGLSEELGFEIVIETTCENALARMKTRQTQGLLLDLDTFRMKGLILLKDLQQEYIQVPTIVLGSSGTEQLLIEALKKGAQDYLIKPISIDLLHEKCLRLFS